MMMMMMMYIFSLFLHQSINNVPHIGVCQKVDQTPHDKPCVLQVTNSMVKTATNQNGDKSKRLYENGDSKNGDTAAWK